MTTAETIRLNNYIIYQSKSIIINCDFHICLVDNRGVHLINCLADLENKKRKNKTSEITKSPKAVDELCQGFDKHLHCILIKPECPDLY